MTLNTRCAGFCFFEFLKYTIYHSAMDQIESTNSEDELFIRIIGKCD